MTAVDARRSLKMSGSAHCDLELAIEVRQCPLGSGARGSGPAVCPLRFGAGEEQEEEKKEEEEEEEEEAAGQL
eukprot:s3243_g1.t1